MTKTLSTSCLALALLASSGVISSVAHAQEPPEAQPPTDNSVPRGGAGAVITHPDAPPPDKPPAPAAPTAPPAGFTMPKALNYAPPIYPPEAEKAGLEGQVVLSLDIDKEGHVTKASVAEPAGHGFDESALAAGRALLFEPARKADGTPFAARIKYRYSFTLTPVAPAPAAPGESAADKRAQSAFSGLVLVAGGTVPIAGATVALSPGGLSATTELDGAFAFKDVPSGKYTVLVRAPGYKPLSVEETLAAGEATEVKYRLSTSSGALEVVVEGDRPPREVTKRTIEAAEIARIPGTNGDALKSLQSLPGVARPPALLGLLIVRGSAPNDTQTFVDGTPVPIIYHFGGLSSVVPTEVLSKIDFYPGNFGTQYGRVQGGIVDVGLRDPKKEYHGLAQIDLIDARLLLEGPIPGLAGWTFLAAGRRSYVDAWLGPVLSATSSGTTEAPVYYDYQFMVAKKPTPKSSFRIAFFGSSDVFKIFAPASASQPELAGQFAFSTAFQRLQLHYANDFGDGNRLNVVAAVGRDEVGIGLGPINFNLDTRSVSGRAEYTAKLGRGMTLNAGVDMYGGYAVVSAQLPPLPVPGQPPNGPFSTANITTTNSALGFFQPGAYLEAEIAPDGNTRVVPGVRLDYFDANKQYDFSPRVNARHDLHKEFPRTTLKGGVGLYHQQPQFQQVLPPFGTPTVKSNRSIQYSVGVEQEFTHQLEASLEGFYKQLDSQVTAAAGTTASGVATTVYNNNGTGYVVGGELLIKYKPDRHFFGWIAYTLSRSVRSDGPGMPEYLFQYDQPHILTVLGSYNFRNGWEFGARYRIVSGSLVTPNVCDVTSSTCNAARVNALFNAASGTYTAIPLSGPFSERLPLFHELDLRVDYTWKFKSWQLSTYLDVQNAYNQANVEGLTYNFNYTARSYVAGLPILPSIGLRGEF